MPRRTLTREFSLTMTRSTTSSKLRGSFSCERAAPATIANDSKRFVSLRIRALGPLENHVNDSLHIYRRAISCPGTEADLRCRQARRLIQAVAQSADYRQHF